MRELTKKDDFQVPPETFLEEVGGGKTCQLDRMWNCKDLI